MDGVVKLEFYKQNIISDDLTLSQVIIKISKVKLKHFLLLTEKKKKIVGTISDGDIQNIKV